jgi:hypothetical protein
VILSEKNLSGAKWSSKTPTAKSINPTLKIYTNVCNLSNAGICIKDSCLTDKMTNFYTFNDILWESTVECTHAKLP